MAITYETFQKEPWPAYDISLDFARDMKSGATLVAVSSTVTATRESDGVDTTATVLGTPTYSGTVVTVRIKAGANGEVHKIQFRVTDSNGEQFEGGLRMEIIEA